MEQLSNKQLIKWSSQGLIPGPGESEAEFVSRANYCLNLRDSLPETACEKECIQNEILKEAHSISKPLFGLEPSWVPIFFSNQKLTPWQAGCAWIFQENKETPKASFFQLRAILKSKSTYLRFYKRKELIAHELCHVARMAFDEPKFEELIAYRTSENNFHRFFGPIIQSSAESMIFALTLVLVLLADLFTLFVDPAAWHFSLYLKLVPATLVLGALIRLVIRQKQYKKCLLTLSSLFKESPEAIALRLTDAEIIKIGTLSHESAKNYLEEKSKTDLRFQGFKLTASIIA
jgi:hypothetical protein